MARKYGDKCFGASETPIYNKVKAGTKMIYIGYTQISEKANESKDISHSFSNVPPCGIRKKKWKNDNWAFWFIKRDLWRSLTVPVASRPNASSVNEE